MESKNLVFHCAATVPVLVFAMVAATHVSVAQAAAMQGGRSATENVRTEYPGVRGIVAEINENNLVRLVGNTRPEARAEFDRGSVAPDFWMQGMVLVLRRSAEQQAAFDAFVQSQYDRSSPNYHHWLTPDEVGQQFGPAQDDIDSISKWLTSRGFSVEGVTKDRMTIQFSGTAGLVRSAFHTEIHRLSVKGEAHVANVSDPAIPAALAPVVVGIKALHDFFPKPMHRLGGEVRLNSTTGRLERVGSATPANLTGADRAEAARSLRPEFNTGGTSTSGAANIEDITPYDFATIYNLLPLWQASTPINGTGQKIAIVATSNINPADVTSFRSSFGLPAYSAPTGSTPGLSVVIPPTTTDPGDCPTAANTCSGDLVENSLDVEWAGATAPGADIILVPSSPGTATDYTGDPVWISASYIVDSDLAPIMNVSYGECELGLGTAGNTGWSGLWQTAASEGIAVFVAAGDEGSASCDAGGDAGGVPYGAQFGLTVSGVASTPYNTAVGGTDFNWIWKTGDQAKYWNTSNDSTTLASAKGYIPEFPWNETCANSLLDASINSQLGKSDTAAQICDGIGTGVITSSGGSILSLVDTIGGSGGKSACTVNNGSTVASCSGGYAKPSWQTGVTGIPTDSKRDIPDVSFFASDGFSGSAYLFCVSAIIPGGAACSYSAATEPTFSEVGGTSVGSPAMAGVMALINQKNGSPFGLPNAELYKLAAKETYSGCSSESVGITGSSCSFYDIDTGTNAVPCDIGSTSDCGGGTSTFGVLSGYSATGGFDLASGLGSLNVANVLANFGPLESISPSSLTFPSTLTGKSSSSQPVTLTNPGTAALSITKIGFTGTNASAFSELDNCGTSVAAGASCTINVTFSPSVGGANSASLSITDNAPGSPQTVTLTGTGVVPAPIASFSTGTLTFSLQTVQTSSVPQSVTLTNTGTATLAIGTIAITGTNASSFLLTPASSCGATLLMGNSCTISVTFKPQTVGPLTASISVPDNATGSPQTVSLSGTGGEVLGSSYTLSAAAVSVSKGMSGTSAITATGSGGYVGPMTVTINSCTLTTSPMGAVDSPTCSITAASVTFASLASTGSGGTVSISTTAASGAARSGGPSAANHLKQWAGAGGAALAMVVLLGIPARRRNWRSLLGLILLAGTLATLAACGGGGGGTHDPGTTSGAYTFTVKGTDSAGSAQSATLNVTVN